MVETENVLKSRATPSATATPPGVGVVRRGPIEPSRKNSLAALRRVEPGLPSQSLVDSGWQVLWQRFLGKME